MVKEASTKGFSLTTDLIKLGSSLGTVHAQQLGKMTFS